VLLGNKVVIDGPMTKSINVFSRSVVLEMERDCIISHGGSSFLREKLFVDSDFYKMNVCGKCGLSSLKGGLECKTCKTSQNVKEISIPYASKLLFQELMAMNITPRIVLDEIAEK